MKAKDTPEKWENDHCAMKSFKIELEGRRKQKEFFSRTFNSSKNLGVREINVTKEVKRK